MTGNQDGYPVVMPKLGLTMTEATIVEWHVTDGAEVGKGALLFTLETEKTVLDIESPAAGAVRLLYQAGDVVPVNVPIAVIGGAASPQPRGGESPAQSVADSSPESGHGVRFVSSARATPKARKLARSHGLSLEGLSGSGVRGMVVVSDVEGALAARQTVRATPVARRVAENLGVDLTCVDGTGARGTITRSDVEGAAAQRVAVASPPDVAAQPLAGLRAIIAERMSAGWRERPQVTLNTEIDATNLVAVRVQLNEELSAAGHDHKVSYNAFIMLAVAKTLRTFPYVNVQLTEAGLVKLPHINVGLAVDTERGLLVPVVRDTDTKSVLDISRETLDVARRAAAGRCLPDELSGGTFTVTNLGMFDIDDFTPIINPPESAILGVGRIVAKPVVVDGQVAVRQMMTLSLSFDHRLIDGAPAARFLQRVKAWLERPAALLLPDL